LNGFAFKRGRCAALHDSRGQIVDLHSLSRAWRGLTIAEEDRWANRQRVSLDRRGRLQSPNPFAGWCAWKRWRGSSTEAFNDVLATIVRGDEVVAMHAERTLVG
jgi:hypothetical protein